MPHLFEPTSTATPPFGYTTITLVNTFTGREGEANILQGKAPSPVVGVEHAIGLL